MRLSAKRRLALYNAISGPIVDLRVEMGIAEKEGARITAGDIDCKLFYLENDIWKRALASLGASDD